jgi:hypothetical protein
MTFDEARKAKAEGLAIVATIDPEWLIRMADMEDGCCVSAGGLACTIKALDRIRSLLAEHLGSEAAADVWLNSTDTGYPTTAMDAIRDGKADLILDDLENQYGPGPSYT